MNPPDLACMTDQYLDVALHVSVSSEREQSIIIRLKELTTASIVPALRNRLRSLWAILGMAERVVVRVCLVAIACTPNVLTPTRILAVCTVRSRSEVVRIEAGSDSLIFSDRDKLKVTGTP